MALPPVPALPDTERRTAYPGVVAATGPYNVGFMLFGDGTDYGNWIEVYVNEVAQSPATWALTSPSGPIGVIPLPIQDAQVTFLAPVTGDIQIVGARRPRRLTQNTENRGVPAHDVNITYSDLEAQLREVWDKLNRTVRVNPGEVMNPLQPLATRASMPAAFDLNGQLIGSQTIPATVVVSPAVGATLSAATLAAFLAAIGVPLFDTVAQANAATLTTNYVRVAGYYAAGDGGGFLAQLVGSAPYQITAANGNHYRICEDRVSPKMFGAKLDGVLSSGTVSSGTDDTAAVQAWAAWTGTSKKYAPAGISRVFLPVIFATGCDYNCPDYTIAGDPTGVFTIAQGGFITQPFPAVASCYGNLVALPGLSVTIAKGDGAITFASAPSLKPGDWFMLFYSPLFSAFRAYYYNGEWMRCRAIAGNVVTLEYPAQDGYTAASCAMYNMTQETVTIRGLKVIGPGVGISRPMDFKWLVEPFIQRLISNNHGNNTSDGVGVNQCIKPLIDACDWRNDAPGTGFQYGGQIYSNHQPVAQNSYFSGTFTGLGVGGGAPETGNIPQRDPVIRNCQLPFGSDMHGNNVNFLVEGCRIDGAVSIGGLNGTYRDCDIGFLAGVFQCTVATEILGGTFVLDNCRLFSFGDPAAFGRGVIDLGGGNAGSVNANTAFDVTYILRSINVSAPTAVTLIRTGNNGSAHAVNLIVDGITGSAPSCPEIALLGALAGSGFSKLIGIQNEAALIGPTKFVTIGANVTDALTAIRLPTQSGMVQVTAAAGQPNVASGTITFRRAYPANPYCSWSVELNGGGTPIDTANKFYQPYCVLLSASTIRLGAALYDSANFGGTKTLNLHWSARYEN